MEEPFRLFSLVREDFGCHWTTHTFGWHRWVQSTINKASSTMDHLKGTSTAALRSCITSQHHSEEMRIGRSGAKELTDSSQHAIEQRSR